jgi:Rrf2 family protein
MKFSSQEEYGLRCLLQLARLAPGGSMTITEISRVEAMAQTHVAKILMILRKGGYIASTRGQLGGYTLARPAEEINVGDVLGLLGGRLYDDGFCGRHGGANESCSHAVDCSVRSLWQVIQNSVDSVLDKISLADLLRDDAQVSNVRFMSSPRRTVGVS